MTFPALLHADTHPENMVPDRSASEVYVEVCVAVLDPHKAVLLDEGLGEEGVVRPVVLHPGHLLSHVRNLHQLGHPEWRFGARQKKGEVRL